MNASPLGSAWNTPVISTMTSTSAAVAVLTCTQILESVDTGTNAAPATVSLGSKLRLATSGITASQPYTVTVPRAELRVVVTVTLAALTPTPGTLRAKSAAQPVCRVSSGRMGLMGCSVVAALGKKLPWMDTITSVVVLTKTQMEPALVILVMT